MSVVLQPCGLGPRDLRTPDQHQGLSFLHPAHHARGRDALIFSKHYFSRESHSFLRLPIKTYFWSSLFVRKACFCFSRRVRGRDALSIWSILIVSKRILFFVSSRKGIHVQSIPVFVKHWLLYLSHRDRGRDSLLYATWYNCQQIYIYIYINLKDTLYSILSMCLNTSNYLCVSRRVCGCEATR